MPWVPAYAGMTNASGATLARHLRGDAAPRTVSPAESGRRLRAARPLYLVASDVGASPPDQKARTAFLDGLAFLQEKDFKKAEQLFTEAARADPTNNEYVFYQGLALVQAGERANALKVLDSRLKDDPRTQVLREIGRAHV